MNAENDTKQVLQMLNKIRSLEEVLAKTLQGVESLRNDCTRWQYEQFDAHLKHASSVVATWPPWKQELLGGKAAEDPRARIRALEDELFAMIESVERMWVLFDRGDSRRDEIVRLTSHARGVLYPQRPDPLPTAVPAKEVYTHWWCEHCWAKVEDADVNTTNQTHEVCGHNVEWVKEV